MTESPSENMASSIDFSSIPQLTFDDGAAVRSKPNESLGGGLLVGYRTISSADKIISSYSENVGVSAHLKTRPSEDEYMRARTKLHPLRTTFGRPEASSEFPR